MRILTGQNKLGRNDPCWCGSRRKYKQCHLQLDKETLPSLEEIRLAVRKTYGKEYCLHPEASKSACSSEIVRAHTIQRNGGLTRIARSGHVYRFEKDWHVLEYDSDDNELPQPILVGCKRASTFTGFCGFHDNSTFAPIEKYPFQSNPQHTFLLGYRAVCMNLFFRQAQLESLPLTSVYYRGDSRQEQSGYRLNYFMARTGFELGVLDAQVIKSEYDHILLKSNFSDAYYYVVRLQDIPEIMCSWVTAPLYDFAGNGLQWLEDTSKFVQSIERMGMPGHYLTFSLIATDEGGAAVFAWVGKNHDCSKFIRSLHELPDSALPHAIVRFAFDMTQNIYFSPDWWESLAPNTQIALRRRAGHNYGMDRDIDLDRLKDDGTRAVSWRIVARETNLRFQALRTGAFSGKIS